jgi:RNA polymerase sigma factor (sigma-70 family)
MAPASDTSALFPRPARVAPVELPSESMRLAAVAGESFSFEAVPQLARALRAGDAAAFRFLHQQWNARILRYCFALAAGDDAFAAEIAQATYLRIFHHVPRAADEAALWNWITCAMRSAAIDLRRVGGRYRRALARFTDWLRFGSGEREAGEDSAMLQALDDAVAKLEPEERYLLDCRYFHREPLDAIASRCGSSTRAIEGRLARIRARLRAELTQTVKRENA